MFLRLNILPKEGGKSGQMTNEFNYLSFGPICSQYLQTSRGLMALQRPGQFVWETALPNQQKIIANGKTAGIYDVDLVQVTRQDLDTQNVNSSVVFLGGGAAAKTLYGDSVG